MSRLKQRLSRLRAPRWVQASYAFARDVFAEFGEDNGYMLAAALSFYAAFAIFPLLLGVIALLSFVFPAAQADRYVLQYAGRLLGGQSNFVSGTLNGIREARGTIGAVSALLLLWSAKGVFQSLSQALNIIYEFKPPATLWDQVRVNAKALGYAVGCGIGVLALAGLYWGVQLLFPRLPAWLGALQNGAPIVGFYLGLLLIYRFLPNGRVGWIEAAISALIGVTLWFPVSIALSFYLTHVANLNAVYGPLSGIMAFYIWLNYTSTVVILGAEAGAVTCLRLSGKKAPESWRPSTWTQTPDLPHH